MIEPTELLKRIDSAVIENADLEFRSHLGASVVGHDCARHVWYSFRWTSKEIPSPRMVRLWARGDNEEFVFEKLLRDADVELFTVDPDTGKQFRISDFGGHFGGSLDGIAGNIPDVAEWCLAEMKTHNDKSFKKLKKEGITKSKPQHFAQMTLYMGYKGLQKALYCAVNKNDDELFFKIVHFNPDFFNRWQMRASNAIQSKTPLEKVSQSSAWYQCKFCEFSNQCHFDEPPLINCRTCEHAIIDMTSDNGTWRCDAQSNKALTKAEQLAGCESYKVNPNFKK
jgi:hypothetical protein